MNFIKQKPGTRLCGQIALAHFLNVPLEEACRLIGHRHGTKPSEMIRVLGAKGFRTSGRMLTKRELWGPEDCWPQNGLFRLSHARSSRWHWVFRHDGNFWDGLYSNRPCPFPNWPKGSRLTSCLLIDRA